MPLRTIECLVMLGASFLTNHPALRRLDASHLDARAPENNSLYEHITFQVARATARSSTRDNLEALIEIISAPYSLNDLVAFSRQIGLIAHFELKPAATGLDRFFKTAQSKLVHGRRSIGLDGGGYLLGWEEMSSQFRDALQNLHLAGGSAYVLGQALDSPFPFLTMNRLMHLCMTRDFQFKTLELANFPWDQKEPHMPASAGDLKGTIHDGFLVADNLSCLNVLENIRRNTDESARVQNGRRWEERAVAVGSGFSKINEELLAELLKIQGTPASLRLSEALERRDIRVKIMSLQEVEDKQQEEVKAGRKHRTVGVSLEGIEAFYSFDETGPWIGLSREKLVQFDWKNPNQLLELASRVLHEGSAHILSQIEDRQDQDWPDNHLFAAEMEAFGEEILFRYVNGDQSLYQTIAQYNPLSFGLALRNFIEHVYFRNAQPLAF